MVIGMRYDLVCPDIVQNGRQWIICLLPQAVKSSMTFL